MGPDLTQSVVDPRLRVHGISGLRVIDASVFPLNISGNTNAAAIVTGAKGADMVLEDQR
jgi:choline dehydrogenase